MQKIDLNSILFFDCETTGLPGKSQKWDIDFMEYPYLVEMAWSIGDKERSYIIRPDNYEIPPETIAIHGITTERAITEGVPFIEIAYEFLEDAKNAPLICAHNIYFDVSLFKANVLRYLGREYYDDNAEDSLHKGKRIDTMMKTIKFVGALYSNGRPGKYPKLEELFVKLFPGETFRAHNALEDVRALRRCVPELVNLGIIELAQKEYPPEQLKLNTEPEKSQIGRSIEFHDINPVTVPIGTNPGCSGVDYENHVFEPERSEIPSNSKTREMLDENEF